MAATLPRGIEEGIAPFKFSRMCGKNAGGEKFEIYNIIDAI
jgi:hypothetical protein